MKFSRNLIISLVLVTSGQVFAAQALPTSITKFAFGSCAKERLPQPIWTQIGAENPDLFLFIGDNNYADWQEVNGKMTSTPVTNKSRFDEAYATLAAIPEFVEFRKNVPLLATWDDHDYGANDGGKEYPLKKYSQKAFIEFFGFEDNHPIHEQQGVYQSYIIGEEGKRVQFILLDTRYHRDAIDKNTDQSLNNTYMATSDTSRSMLGEAQWRWLEKTLKQPAEIRFIVSSIQVVAYQHGWESWGTMPHERQS